MAEKKPETEAEKAVKQMRKNRARVKRKYIEKIKADCTSAGTYRPEFDRSIEILAEIMVQRDKAWEEFEQSGGTTMVEHTNKSGATNMIRNPLLVAWNELNRDVLSYQRDMGLTAAGLKKLHEDALKGKKKSALGEALKSIGG